MKVKTPTNLLYANTATVRSASSPRARTRSVRSRVGSNVNKIGILDISARAGLLFDLLNVISRRQQTFTFYAVETPVPTGLGEFSDRRIEEMAVGLAPEDRENIRRNVEIESFETLLEATREQVKVDLIAGLFGPMLAFWEGGQLCYNYFSAPIGRNVAVSVYDLRDYAKRAGRPFEAAVALVTLAQVWGKLYGIGYHHETRGCAFDFCEDRSDLIESIRVAELCPESREAVPADARDSVEKCLQTIREYER